MKKLNMKFPVTCKTGEIANDYKSYLQTKHWANVRERFKNSKYEKKCNVCGVKNQPLDLHHKSYKRLGDEYLWHLIYLCREHHQNTHTVYKTSVSRKTNLWNSHKKVKKQGNKKAKQT